MSGNSMSKLIRYQGRGQKNRQTAIDFIKTHTDGKLMPYRYKRLPKSKMFSCWEKE